MSLPVRKLYEIELLVIHCADTPNGYARYTIRDIDKWHGEKKMRRHGKNLEFPHIGYHYVIEVDGVIKKGRELSEIGAHAAPHNSESIGVCMIGRDKFTAEQWDSLKMLVNNLFALLPNMKRIVGHRDLTYRRVCPGFDVHAWYYNQNMVPSANHICDSRR